MPACSHSAVHSTPVGRVGQRQPFRLLHAQSPWFKRCRAHRPPPGSGRYQRLAAQTVAQAHHHAVADVERAGSGLQGRGLRRRQNSRGEQERNAAQADAGWFWRTACPSPYGSANEEVHLEAAMRQRCGEGWESSCLDPKPESRRPKAERNPEPETRIRNALEGCNLSAIAVLRISNFGLRSVLEFRPSSYPARQVPA